MKKLTLLGLLLAFAMFAQAQSKKDSLLIGKGLSKSLLGNNEVKFNFLSTVFGQPELTYERIITNNMAVGASFFSRLGNATKFKYGVIPYYRYYFGARKVSGLFLEANAALLRYDPTGGRTDYYIDFSGNQNPISDFYKNVFGLGAAAGAKFLTRSGFTAEIYLGAGQPIYTNAFAYPRIGLILGKRF